jgi:hypothetical protein
VANQVLLKKSSVVGKVPTSSDLTYGELALNYADGKLYFKDTNNTIQNFSNKLSINDLTDVDTSSSPPSIGSVLKWDGSKWAPGVDSTTGGTGTDADTLDGFDSSYFLNYNNLTNKPTTVSSFTNDANYVNTTQLATKQNTLVSGTNIKTINGQPLLGSGNIAITGGTGDGLYTNNTNLTTTASNQEVDSFDKTQFRTVKYLIQAISGSEVHTTEVTLTHNDTNIFINEYGTMYTGTNPLITAASSIDATNVYLTVTPANADTTIDLTRISIIARVLGGTVFDLEGDLMLQSGSEDLLVGTGSIDLLT